MSGRGRPKHPDILTPREWEVMDELRQAEKRPSTWFRPQLEAKGYRPLEGKEATSKDVGRHEKLSKKEIEERWTKR